MKKIFDNKNIILALYYNLLCSYPETQWLYVCSIYPQASCWYPVICLCFILTLLCNSLSVVLSAISFCHPDWCTSWPHISGSQHTSSFSPSVLSMRLVTFPHQYEPCHSFPWLCDPISLEPWTLLGSLHLNYKRNTQPFYKYLCLSDNGNSRLYPASVIQSEQKSSHTQSI